MLEAAAQAAGPSLVLAVSILTSGRGRGVRVWGRESEVTSRRGCAIAWLAAAAGVGGLVCSGRSCPSAPGAWDAPHLSCPYRFADDGADDQAGSSRQARQCERGQTLCGWESRNGGARSGAAMARLVAELKSALTNDVSS